jgi:2-haloacid dehalogenase
LVAANPRKKFRGLFFYGQDCALTGVTTLLGIFVRLNAMLNFSQFKILTFDCYGTLIDWESGIFSALRPILATHGKTLGDEALLELYGELELEAESEEFKPYREVLQAVVHGFGKRLGFAPTKQEAESLPNSLAGWLPFPDTVESLRRLSTRYKLAIISNVDDDLFAASAKRLQVAFDYVTTAQQAGAYKPSLKIFNLALKKIALPNQQILHCGQSVYHDVLPAQSLGLATVWVNRPSPRVGVGAVKAASGKPDIQVNSLKALADLALTEN